MSHRPWSDEAMHEASEQMHTRAVKYHAAWWRDDLRAILDYRLRVRRAHAAILAGASLREVEP